MFQALICPSSGVCDYIVELTHWLFRAIWGAGCSWHPGYYKTANVVVQQYSRKLLMMGLLMPEIC